MGKRQSLKFWAYLNQIGSAKINAPEVLKREQAEPGRWKRRTYFSTHSPGKRWEMHHRRSNMKTSSFAYNSSQSGDSDGERADGESLNHYLFKHAISKLNRTTLRFRLGDSEVQIPVEFSSHEVESKISHDGEEIYADVLSSFISESPFFAKWEGQIAFEVCHKHPVDERKANVYQAAQLAAVESKVGQLIYRTPEERSTEHSEKGYIDWLLPRLRDYMLVTVISNPSSKVYLAGELQRTSIELRRCRESNARLLAIKRKDEIRIEMLHEKVKALEVENRIRATRSSRFEELSFLQRLKFLFTKKLS